MQKLATAQIALSHYDNKQPLDFERGLGVRQTKSLCVGPKSIHAYSDLQGEGGTLICSHHIVTANALYVIILIASHDQSGT